MASTIKLQSSDGHVFSVDMNVAKCSPTIKTMLKDFGVEEDGENGIVPLPCVSGAMLEKVVTWLTHHQDNPAATMCDPNAISDWDADFFKNVDINTLFEFITVARYLGINGLRHITMMTLAKMIRGRSPEELRDTFGAYIQF